MVLCKYKPPSVIAGLTRNPPKKDFAEYLHNPNKQITFAAVFVKQ
jgi:hypothetical protein